LKRRRPSIQTVSGRFMSEACPTAIGTPDQSRSFEPVKHGRLSHLANCHPASDCSKLCQLRYIEQRELSNEIASWSKITAAVMSDSVSPALLAMDR
jgi:hypothetical protein